MNQGWIKLHRKLFDNAVMTKSAYLHLWVTLLLLANHEETTFIFNDKEKTLQPGQLITGLLKLKKITRIPTTTIRRILKFLENGNMISQYITTKFRIVTILNWQYYQSQEADSGNQMVINRQSGGNQAATYKNDKNEKNVKNYRGGFHSEIDKQKQMIRDTLKKLEAEGVF